MRCPDCNKFTGLENGDPQVNEDSTDADENGVKATFSVEMERNCADCSTTLKTFSGECEIEKAWEDLDGWDKLPEKVKEYVKENAGSLDVECSEENSSVDESGGGRYKKNMITTSLDVAFTVKFTYGNKEYKLTGGASGTCEAAAGEFEEAV